MKYIYALVHMFKRKILNSLENYKLYRNFTIILTFLSFISAIATYSAITNSSSLLGPDPELITNLILLNLVLFLSLFILISRKIFLIWINRKNKLGGSRLQTRILLMFCIVATVPTIIVALFSTLFFNYGIESWFNQKVSTALEESVKVADTYLEEHNQKINKDARLMEFNINQIINHLLFVPENFNNYLFKSLLDFDLVEATVFQLNPNKILAQSSSWSPNKILAPSSFGSPLLLGIPNNVMNAAMNNDVVVFGYNMNDISSSNIIKALVKIEGLPNTFLLIGRFIDEKVLMHRIKTNGAVSEYFKLKSQISSLQIKCSIVFFVVALLLLLAAIWLGIMFAAALTKPISYLVTATEKIKGGDFKIHVKEGPENDEIAVLTRAFNRMTVQLERQRNELIEANKQIDTRRQFSETILSSVSAGVIALNPLQKITMINPSAINTLKLDPISFLNLNFSKVFPEMHNLLKSARNEPENVKKGEISFVRNNKNQILLVRIMCYKNEKKIQGYVVTFDDITTLVLAQRAAAWSDIARRIAHEIKNPLTPINLAAERLKKKYGAFVEDKNNFNKYIDTIEKNVEDIGLMVEEFVNFARMPSPIFKVINITKLIQETIFTRECLENNIQYEFIYPKQILLINGDERQLAQVLTNIFKNSEESILQKKLSITSGLIIIKIESKENEIIISVEDNGVGFPNELFEHLTEPYLTNKPTGTGLGLAIVKKIMDDHLGHIEFANKSSDGAIIRLFLPLKV